jgi:hypothetical protein
LIADLTRFWGWGPHDGFSLTGSELLWWHNQANRIIDRDAAQRTRLNGAE